EDGVGAHGDVARRLAQRKTVRGLEPLARFVDQRDERNGAAGEAGGGACQRIEATFRFRVEQPQLTQHGEASRFVDRKRGRLHRVGAGGRRAIVSEALRLAAVPKWRGVPALRAGYDPASRRATKSSRSWPQKISPSIT